MLRTILSLMALLLATGASAQSRPVTTSMRCAQANALVTAQGGVVLNTGPYTYDRYVSSGRSCGSSEATSPAWVPTADNQQCFIGYRCRGTGERESSR